MVGIVARGNAGRAGRTTLHHGHAGMLGVVVPSKASTLKLRRSILFQGFERNRMTIHFSALLAPCSMMMSDVGFVMTLTAIRPSLSSCYLAHT